MAIDKGTQATQTIHAEARVTLGPQVCTYAYVGAETTNFKRDLLLAVWSRREPWQNRSLNQKTHAQRKVASSCLDSAVLRCIQP